MIYNFKTQNVSDIFYQLLAEIKDTNKPETTYTEADLVSFGKFLLSENRRNFFKQMPIKGNPLAERLKHVHDADLQNWKEKKTSVQQNQQKMIGPNSFNGWNDSQKSMK